MTSFLRWFQNLLEHPIKVAFFALAIAIASLLAQGTLIDLWNLKTEQSVLERRYEQTVQKNADLQFKIQQARNSDMFIGHEAREKLDLVKNDELVFIFENDSTTETPSAKR